MSKHRYQNQSRQKKNAPTHARNKKCVKTNRKKLTLKIARRLCHISRAQKKSPPQFIIISITLSTLILLRTKVTNGSHEISRPSQKSFRESSRRSKVQTGQKSQMVAKRSQGQLRNPYNMVNDYTIPPHQPGNLNQHNTETMRLLLEQNFKNQRKYKDSSKASIYIYIYHPQQSNGPEGSFLTDGPEELSLTQQT
jgi:hypothetical protein